MAIKDEGMSLVRGLAALVVVIAHANQIFLLRFFGLDHVSGRIFGQLASQAVLVFFIVSGYLITLSIIKNINRNKRFDLLDYAAARISRIFPPLIFSVIVCFILYFVMRLLRLPGSDLEGAVPYGVAGDLYIARSVFTINVMDLVGLLRMKDGFLQTNGPLWSLYIEWRIYIAAGCIVMLFSSKKLIWKAGYGGLFIYVLFQIKNVDANAVFYTAIWLLGGGLALLKNHFNVLIPSKVLIKTSLLILGVCFYVSPDLMVDSRLLTTPGQKFVQFTFGALWAGLIFPSFDVCATRINVILMRVGGFSYTLYIIHFPVMLFLLSLAQGVMADSLVISIGVSVIAIVFALIVSYFSAKYFENKNRFFTIIRTSLNFLVPQKRQRKVNVL